MHYARGGREGGRDPATANGVKLRALFIQPYFWLHQVSAKQKDTEEDLAKAEPAVVAAMAALDTLNKKASVIK